MGIEWQAAKWFLWLAESGLQFGRTLTLGRQNLYLSPEHVREICHRFNVDEERFNRYLSVTPEYVEPFFQMLGAEQVDSMDASGYEGATIVHDLNNAIPDDLANRYDMVYDGGTLEHVFNFAEAMRNAMRLVRVGGSLVMDQCFNNLTGHGFYCFSADMFFRALSEENGFRILNVRVHERYPRSPWYRIPDPESIRQRVRLVGFGLESMILVHAVKVKDVPIFAKWPQQSDYAASWEGERREPTQAELDRAKLGMSWSGLPGRLARTVMWPLRRRALSSPFLGKFGKRWLNRTLRIQSQPNCFILDDPFLNGGKAAMLPEAAAQTAGTAA